MLIAAAALALLLILGMVAWSYRYLLLSKLNLQAGANESRLGLRLVAEIPLPGSATRFDYQSVDDPDRLLFMAHLGADQLLVFDLQQGQVAATIPDIARAHGIIAVPETGRLYAAATGTHQIAVIDLHTYQLLARVEGGDYPDGLAYDPQSRKLFVSDETGGGVIVIDTQTNQRIQRIDLGGEVGNTQYDAQGQQIVSAAQGRNQLVLIDPKRDVITSAIDLPGCDGPHGFYLDSPSRQVFVSCEGNARLLVVNLDSQQVTASDQVGEIPDVLAFDPGLQRLYVAAESGVVTVFQLTGASLDKIGQSYLAPNAHTIAVDPQTHRVYVPLENIKGHPLMRVYEPLQK